MYVALSRLQTGIGSVHQFLLRISRICFYGFLFFGAVGIAVMLVGLQTTEALVDIGAVALLVGVTSSCFFAVLLTDAEQQDRKRTQAQAIARQDAELEQYETAHNVAPLSLANWPTGLAEPNLRELRLLRMQNENNIRQHPKELLPDIGAQWSEFERESNPMFLLMLHGETSMQLAMQMLAIWQAAQQDVQR